jgi:hypothetical protein
VDAGAGQAHAREAERQRQRRRGERAEHGEEDQQHDREAGHLGGLEVLLDQVLHAGPEGLLTDQVGLHAGALSGEQLLAEVGGQVGQLVL